MTLFILVAGQQFVTLPTRGPGSETNLGSQGVCQKSWDIFLRWCTWTLGGEIVDWTELLSQTSCQLSLDTLLVFASNGQVPCPALFTVTGNCSQELKAQVKNWGCLQWKWSSCVHTYLSLTIPLIQAQGSCIMMTVGCWRGGLLPFLCGARAETWAEDDTRPLLPVWPPRTWPSSTSPFETTLSLCCFPVALPTLLCGTSSSPRPFPPWPCCCHLRQMQGGSWRHELLVEQPWEVC